MAARPLLVGVDVGSRHIKAGLVAADGRVVAVARARTPVRHLPDGGAVHPTADLVSTVEAVVRDASAKAGADAHRVEAVGIASVAEAGALLDARLEPLHDVVAWFDARSAPDAARLVAEVGAEELFARTGQRGEAKHAIAKIAWLGREEPGVRSRARAWASVADLVALRWTGALGTAASLACRTLGWNLPLARWDGELLAHVGLAPESMPPVLPADRPVGRLARGAADRLGFQAGVPVAVAGHDHVVGALGAGVAAPGDALDSLGTAEAVVRVTDRPVLDDEVRRAGFSVGAHVLPGRYVLIGGLPVSGGLVEWALDLVGAPPEPVPRYAFLRELVGALPRRPTGIVVRPTPTGRGAPAPDPAAVATLEGFRLEHGPAHVLRAVLEGIGCHVRWMLERLESLSQAPLTAVAAIGGGSANEDLVAIKAALGPGRLEVAVEPDAVVLGAALVGGLAGGSFGTEREVLAGAAPTRRVDVDPAVSAAYDAFYRERWMPAGHLDPVAPGPAGR